MRKRHLERCGAVAIMATLGALPDALHAVMITDLTLTSVAGPTSTVDGAPGESFTHFGEAPSIDDEGNIAFTGRTNAVPAGKTTQREGVYTIPDAGVIRLVADTTTPVTSGLACADELPSEILGFFIDLEAKVSIDAGGVAFRAQAVSDPNTNLRAIYTNANTDGVVQCVVFESQEQGGIGGSTLTRPWLDNGVLAYTGRTFGPSGLEQAYIRKLDTVTGQTTVFDSPDPDARTNEDSFHRVSLAGDAVTVEEAIFTKELQIDGGPQAGTVIKVAVFDANGDLVDDCRELGNECTKVPGKDVYFRNFSHFPVLDEDSDIAFFAQDHDFGEGIYRRISGVLETVADITTPIPGGLTPGASGNFAGFFPQSVAIADGHVAFLGFDEFSALGIYFFDSGGTMHKIVDTNDMVTIGNDTFAIRLLRFASEGFVETPTGFSAVFWADLVGGSTHLVRADITVATELVSSTLPTSRSVQVDTTATAFATIINVSGADGRGCRLQLADDLDADFSYQTTDPATNVLIGDPNQPVDIAAGGFATFAFFVTPRSELEPTDVRLKFGCDNLKAATPIQGLNTLLLSSSLSAVPDVIALADTVTKDGIVHLDPQSNVGFFAMASVNVGTDGDFTVEVDVGNLPASATICQTDPLTAACINPPDVATDPTVQVPISMGDTPTFSVFVTATEDIALDPAAKRIFVRFRDSGGDIRGATSVAVQTD